MTQSAAVPSKANVSATDLVTVSRAVADLRRGEIVLVQGQANGIAHCVAVIAAEPLSDHGLARLHDIAGKSGNTAIVLPRVRARSLGKTCKNDHFIAFVSAKKSAVHAKALAEIANPLLDLESMPAGA